MKKKQVRGDPAVNIASKKGLLQVWLWKWTIKFSSAARCQCDLVRNGQRRNDGQRWNFQIPADTIQRLIISYTGYESDTIAIHPAEEIRVVMASGGHLKEVKVTARQKASYISLLNPVRTQTMTDKELFKAACCNLSESFETNPSVDVSYNDAVTGSKQIQLLGLSGSYTQFS